MQVILKSIVLVINTPYYQTIRYYICEQNQVLNIISKEGSRELHSYTELNIVKSHDESHVSNLLGTSVR